MKHCNICNTTKDSADFYKDNRAKDGLQSKCKVCEKKYKEANKERQVELKANHYQKNKEAYKQRARLYKKKHRSRMRVQLFKERPEQKLLHYYRTRLNQAVKSKTNTTIDLLGCSAKDLADYLEARFKVGMTWGNYGLHGWHIDHIIPCAKFDMSNDSDVKQCFHYTNLQPLWAKDNLEKADKLIKNQLSIRI